tara:strand:- start:2912 stop:3706 length:795 start_codon:yes stop_codon:yes gene_type:complete
MADPEIGEGAVDDNLEGTVDDTGTDAGTTVEESRTSGDAPEDRFFDPRDLPDELLPAYKGMQASFTKRMQGLKDGQNKIDAYDTFYRDPVGSVQAIAAQNGYQLTRQEAAAVSNAQNQPAEEWQPQNWEDVTARSVDLAKQSILQELGPFLNEVKGYKRDSIERVLDDEVPEWRQYEDDMIRVVQQHPTLADDAAMLARLALPKEVVEGRAMKSALRRLEKKGESGKVTGGSRTRETPRIDPDRPMSFAEAVEFAREQARNNAA